MNKANFWGLRKSLQQSKKLSRDGNGTLHTRHNEQLKSKIHRNPHYITTLKLRMTPQ